MRFDCRLVRGQVACVSSLLKLFIVGVGDSGKVQNASDVSAVQGSAGNGQDGGNGRISDLLIAIEGTAQCATERVNGSRAGELKFDKLPVLVNSLLGIQDTRQQSIEFTAGNGSLPTGLNGRWAISATVDDFMNGPLHWYGIATGGSGLGNHDKSHKQQDGQAES